LLPHYHCPLPHTTTLDIPFGEKGLDDRELGRDLSTTDDGSQRARSITQRQKIELLLHEETSGSVGHMLGNTWNSGRYM